MDNIDKLDSVMNNEAEKKKALMLAADAACCSLKKISEIRCSMLNASINEFMCPRKYIIVPTSLEEFFQIAVEKHFDGGVRVYTKENSTSIDSFLYYNSSGKLRTRTRTQTLHATVIKPKPYYNTQVVLNYGSQGGSELSFSRDASHLDKKSEKAIERHIKRGEKKLKRLTDKAIKNNDDFTSMSNSEFEVLFDALDRTDEVQFRALFTPLAQTNLVDLILSRTGYGDDFNFFKQKRMNRIISNHSQGRPMNLLPKEYTSYSFDFIKNNFINKNIEFFKAIYFDFAPLLSIPAYQERPVHSLKPIPDYSQLYSLKESEALANAVDTQYVVHPNTKTQAILKSSFVSSKDNVDETCITAYSYDIEQRVDKGKER